MRMWRLRSSRSCIYIALVLIAVGAHASPVHAESVAPAEPEAALPAEVERARQVLLPFKRSLKQTLVAGMAQGPEQAVRSCKLQAPEIAEAAASKGVAVGRTSHRLRNAANAPADWMKPFLDEFLAEGKGGAARWVELPAGSFGYVEPIYVQPLCLNCHGDSLAPELRKLILEMYPQDEATGFAEGDFRGLFWVVLDAEARAAGERE